MMAKLEVIFETPDTRPLEGLECRLGSAKMVSKQQQPKQQQQQPEHKQQQSVAAAETSHPTFTVRVVRQY